MGTQASDLRAGCGPTAPCIVIIFHIIATTITRGCRSPRSGGGSAMQVLHDPLPGLTAEDDDAVLVARARRDRGAFAPLYRRHVGPIYGFCHHRLGAREAAEDAASLVFAKALASLSSFRGDSFRAWLFGIAHHVVADALRSRGPDAPLDSVPDPVDRSPRAGADRPDRGRPPRPARAAGPADARPTHRGRVAAGRALQRRNRRGARPQPQRHRCRAPPRHADASRNVPGGRA